MTQTLIETCTNANTNLASCHLTRYLITIISAEWTMHARNELNKKYSKTITIKIDNSDTVNDNGWNLLTGCLNTTNDRCNKNITEN